MPSGSSQSLGSTSDQTSTGTTGGTSTTVTAQQLVADQKSIDAARAALRVAKSNRGLAVLRTPISGTVADLSISKGDSASTSSTAMSVVGKGHKSVVVDISLADIDLVHVGDHVSVTVDGLDTPLAARVTQVGMTNTSSSTGSSSTYAVTVVLNKTNARLYDGMGASVSIAVGAAKSVVTVPISAVSTTGSLNTVRVYSKGKVTTTRVTIGVQGATKVQIKSGLTAGQEVVIAEVSAAIPSSNSTQNRFGGTGNSLTSGLSGGGSFPGGGGFARPGG